MMVVDNTTKSNLRSVIKIIALTMMVTPVGCVDLKQFIESGTENVATINEAFNSRIL